MRLGSSRAARSLALLTALCLALALALGGCGGDGDEESVGSETPVAQKQQGSALEGEVEGRAEDEGEVGKAPGREQEQEGRKGEPSHSPNPPIATERTPGSKAVAPGVPTTKGGDNSIQAFGVEGETDEAAQAAANLRAYLDARANGDWQGACAAASQEYREQLEAVVKGAKGKEEPKGCAEILSLLYGKAPEQALREAAQLKQVLSFRVKADGYAYLIFEDGKGEVRFIAMADDNGAWKVNTPEPTSFPETEAQGSTQ